jgi:hypothetical protein
VYLHVLLMGVLILHDDDCKPHLAGEHCKLRTARHSIYRDDRKFIFESTPQMTRKSIISSRLSLRKVKK